jgi:hypothetical protein
MRILRPGQRIKLDKGKDSDFDAMDAKLLEATLYRDGTVGYRCGWWIDNTPHDCWFYPDDIIEHEDRWFELVPS